MDYLGINLPFYDQNNSVEIQLWCEVCTSDIIRHVIHMALSIEFITSGCK
jgi:hypothetical protein